MLRFLRSLLLGLLLGLLVGLYFGWIQFPATARNSKLSDLAPRYQDDYAMMVAAGYAADADLTAALQRLSWLELADAPSYLRQRTEQIISASARSLADIQLLVRLVYDLGQLTPPMRPFLNLNGEEA